MRLSIAPNPSHLEFIGPVVLGMVRAEQTRLQDKAKERVMGLLIHGDAAFAGLGVVAETLQLADTPGKCHLMLGCHIVQTGLWSSPWPSCR